MERVTYLDHAATTPMYRESIEAMLPYFDVEYANPSGSHRAARRARRALDEARDQIADLIGVTPGEVVFTGCGTESDNTLITGVVERVGGRPVCSAAEHHAVLHPVEHSGGVVVGVDPTGAIDLERLESTLADMGSTATVVSVMAVNNEVGTITDLVAVSEMVRRLAPQAVLHTDAVQAPMWLDLREISQVVDSMSLSAHKFGGPKGVGILTLGPTVECAPLILGGGQERDRRSGTHNVAGIVGAATALGLTDRDRSVGVERVAGLRNRLVDILIGEIDGVRETVPRHRKIAGGAHLVIDGVESEALLFLLDERGVCASAASACASGAMDPSHVLAAMGIDTASASGAVRLSLGHTTTDADIDRAIEAIVDSVGRLRRGRSCG